VISTTSTRTIGGVAGSSVSSAAALRVNGCYAAFPSTACSSIAPFITSAPAEVGKTGQFAVNVALTTFDDTITFTLYSSTDGSTFTAVIPAISPVRSGTSVRVYYPAPTAASTASYYLGYSQGGADCAKLPLPSAAASATTVPALPTCASPAVVVGTASITGTSHTATVPISVATATSGSGTLVYKCTVLDTTTTPTVQTSTPAANSVCGSSIQFVTASGKTYALKVTLVYTGAGIYTNALGSSYSLDCATVPIPLTPACDPSQIAISANSSTGGVKLSVDASAAFTGGASPTYAYTVVDSGTSTVQASTAVTDLSAIQPEFTASSPSFYAVTLTATNAYTIQNTAVSCTAYYPRAVCPAVAAIMTVAPALSASGATKTATFALQYATDGKNTTYNTTTSWTTGVYTSTDGITFTAVSSATVGTPDANNLVVVTYPSDGNRYYLGVSVAPVASWTGTACTKVEIKDAVAPAFGATCASLTSLIMDVGKNVTAKVAISNVTGLSPTLGCAVSATASSVTSSVNATIVNCTAGGTLMLSGWAADASTTYTLTITATNGNGTAYAGLATTCTVPLSLAPVCTSSGIKLNSYVKTSTQIVPNFTLSSFAGGYNSTYTYDILTGTDLTSLLSSAASVSLPYTGNLSTITYASNIEFYTSVTGVNNNSLTGTSTCRAAWPRPTCGALPALMTSAPVSASSKLTSTLKLAAAQTAWVNDTAVYVCRVYRKLATATTTDLTTAVVDSNALGSAGTAILAGTCAAGSSVTISYPDDGNTYYLGVWAAEQSSATPVDCSTVELRKDAAPSCGAITVSDVKITAWNFAAPPPTVSLASNATANSTLLNATSVNATTLLANATNTTIPTTAMSLLPVVPSNFLAGNATIAAATSAGTPILTKCSVVDPDGVVVQNLTTCQAGSVVPYGFVANVSKVYSLKVDWINNATQTPYYALTKSCLTPINPAPAPVCAAIPVNISNAGYIYGTTVQLDYLLASAILNGSDIVYMCSIRDTNGALILSDFVCSDKSAFAKFQFPAPSAGDYMFVVTSSSKAGGPVSLCVPVKFSVPVAKAPVTYAVTTIIALTGETKASFTPQKQETFLTVLATQLKVLRAQVSITDMLDITLRRRSLKTTALQLTLSVTGLVDQNAANAMSTLINSTVSSPAFTSALVAAGLPQYSITVTGTPTVVQLGTNTTSSSSSTNTPLIIGLVVGLVGGALVAGGIAAIVIIKRRKQRVDVGSTQRINVASNS